MATDAPVGIIGAGPVGLALAARLASFGIACIVLEAEPQLRPQGSKACLIQGDVLEVLDKVGCAEPIAEEGVTWSVGHTYVRDREIRTEVYGDRIGFGPFVNISQYRIEQILLEHLSHNELVDIRWGHRVTGVRQSSEGVELACNGGTSHVGVAYAVACDGVRSELRSLVGVEWTGYTHGDRFLITDIEAKLPLRRERHFHYDPSSNPRRQVVMHPQPANVWRIDWQLSPDADIAEERRTGAFDRRVRAVIGDIPYEVRWWSTYRFHQRVIESFVAGRVLFAGDAAHALPPYGARGMNSGIQDADNLAWKLALVVTGRADESLLATYHDERFAAAQENLAVTEATIRFMVPATWRERLARRMSLALSRWSGSARQRVDSGRMAEPFVYRGEGSVDRSVDHQLLGRFAPDGWVATGHGSERVRRLFGSGFVVLAFVESSQAAARFVADAVPRPLPALTEVVLVVAADRGPLVAADRGPLVGDGIAVVHDHPDDAGLRARYGALDPKWLLVRPDSHVYAAGPIGRAPVDLAGTVGRSARVQRATEAALR